MTKMTSKPKGGPFVMETTAKPKEGRFVTETTAKPMFGLAIVSVTKGPPLVKDQGGNLMNGQVGIVVNDQGETLWTAKGTLVNAHFYHKGSPL